MFSRNSFTEICADWNNIWLADACPLHSSNKKAWNSGRMEWEKGTTHRSEKEKELKKRSQKKVERGVSGKFSHFFHFHNSYENISIFLPIVSFPTCSPSPFFYSFILVFSFSLIVSFHFFFIQKSTGRGVGEVWFKRA